MENQLSNFFFQIATIADRRRLLLSTAESVYLGIKKYLTFARLCYDMRAEKPPIFIENTIFSNKL